MTFSEWGVKKTSNYTVPGMSVKMENEWGTNVDRKSSYCLFSCAGQTFPEAYMVLPKFCKTLSSGDATDTPASSGYSPTVTNVIPDRPCKAVNSHRSVNAKEETGKHTTVVKYTSLHRITTGIRAVMPD